MSKSSTQPVDRQALVNIYREALLQDTPIDEVSNTVNRLWSRAVTSQSVETKLDSRAVEQIRQSLPLLVRVGAFTLPVLFISVGFFLLGNALIPIGSYYVTTLPTLTSSDLMTPVPPEQVLDINPVIIARASEPGADETVSDSGPTIIDTKLDYTNLANWFADAAQPELALETAGANLNTSATPQTSEYILNIPSLNIENAVVKIGGTNLNENLIQFPGTADPGNAGAPVIFGHSVLRQFYNPSEKNPRRYMSIFSTIMTLKNGDEIFVKVAGVEYKYVVRDKTEVKPEDVHILTQNYDARQLKLVTCTPEGTYLRRGVVTAQLVST